MAIKITDKLIPATDNYKVVDADHVGYNGESVAHALSLINATLTGIPTFEVTNIPESLTPGEPFSFEILIESVTNSECRIVINQEQEGSNTITTYTDSTYPGIPKTIQLTAPKGLGTFTYTISASSGSKRCAVKGTETLEDDIKYSTSFVVPCGTATLTVPNFTKSNTSAIYSYSEDDNDKKEFVLDLNYTTATVIDSYESIVTIGTTANPTAICNITTPHSVSVDYSPGNIIKENLTISEAVKNEYSGQTIVMSIYCRGYKEGSLITTTTTATITFNLDFMESNSVTQSYTIDTAGLTSNSYINFSFIPKTNMTGLQGSGALRYEYSLYRDMDGSQTLIGQVKVIYASHLKTSSITLERLISLDNGYLSTIPSGNDINYYISLQCTDNQITNKQHSIIEFTVKKVEDSTGTYEKNNLRLFFDFSDAKLDEDSTSTIIPNAVEGHQGYSLTLLNATRANLKEGGGRIETADTPQVGKEDTATYYTFKAGQGAILTNDTGHPSCPLIVFSTDTNKYNNITPVSGYTVEAFLKSPFLGTYDLASLSIGQNTQRANLLTSGVLIQPNDINVHNGETASNASLAKSKWKHVVCSVEFLTTTYKDENGKDVTRDEELHKIYIDGVLSKLNHYTSRSSWTGENYTASPLAINGIINASGELTHSGIVNIKFLRYYSKALTDEQVYNNFLTCFNEAEYVNIIKARNDPKNVVNVFFIRNAEPKKNKNSLYYDTFETLHKITKKKADKGDPADLRTSKNTAVNCTMVYTYTTTDGLGNVTNNKNIYTNIDVYLQGTSSLKYPVKNYQIISYNEDQAGDKDAILPPTITPAMWPTSSSVYTLKCDFMEESHRNNTPTAGYYQDNVLPNVLNYVKTTDYYGIYSATNPSNPSLYRQNSEYAQYSPARRITRELEGGEIVTPYRDAIDGIPCIVYYTDNYFDPTNDDSDAIASKATYAGSFMFNVDKEGSQLGFNLTESEIGLDSSYKEGQKVIVGNDSQITFAAHKKLLLDNLPCISYEGATNNNYSAAAFIPYDGQRLVYLQSIWKSLTTVADKGKQTWLRKVHSATQQDVENGLAKALGELIYTPNDNADGFITDSEYTVFFNPSSFGTINDFNITIIRDANGSDLPETLAEGKSEFAYYIGASLETSKVWRFTGDAWDLVWDPQTTTDLLFQEGSTSTSRIYKFSFLSYIAGIFHDKLPSLNNMLNRALVCGYTLKEHQDIFGKNEEEYINNTLEPRFTYTDDLTIDQLLETATDAKKSEYENLKVQLENLENAAIKDADAIEECEKKIEELEEYLANVLAFAPIKRAITWTYDLFNKLENGTAGEQEVAKTTFQNEFNSYFNFEYCLAYFLQLMVFTQVDNAGKNAMFDTWGDGRLYPRPYDMDTQMGLDNSGNDIILSCAELNPIFSPQKVDPILINSMQNYTTSTSHPRFNMYNTTNSALWKSFGLCFKTEIQDCYAYLRSHNIYNPDVIQSYVNEKTRNKIGETYYNRDAQEKYFGNKNYYYCVNGSREDRYYEFLSERIRFLDSYYNYCPYPDVNDINLRGDVEETNYLVIQALSPIYIQVEAEPNTSRCLITPDDTYTENGIPKKGSKFILGINADNKNIDILGSDVISSISGLDKIAIASFIASYADNLTTLDLSNAQKLTNLNLEENKNLKHINLSGDAALTMSIDLTNCPNLETIDVSYSGITELRLPQNSNINYINCTGCMNLQSLELINLPNLTKENLILTNCNLASLTFNNCPKIVSTEDDPYIVETESHENFSTLTNLTIIDCPKFNYLKLNNRTLNNLTVNFGMSGEGLTILDLKDCAGTAFTTLNLTNCPNINYINLEGIKSNGLDTDTDTLILPKGNNGSDLILSYFNIKGSALRTISNDILVPEEFNFNGISFSGTVQMSNNSWVTAVKGLNLTTNLESLFSNCGKLNTLTNCNLTCTPNTTISSLFYNCSNLQEFDNCTFNFDNATKANNTLQYCYKLTQNGLNTILDAISDNTEITEMRSFAYSVGTGYKDEADRNNRLIIGNYNLPKSVTDLTLAFYSSNVATIKAGLFIEDSLVESLSQTFGNCSDLAFVHKDIFKYCTKLKSLSKCFYQCSKLGSTKADDLVGAVDTADNICRSTLDIFPETNDINSISYMFYKCSQLENTEGIGDGFIAEEDSETDNTYANILFSKLSKLTNAVCAFNGTSKLRLNFKDAIFNFSNTDHPLAHIDGLFAYSGLQALPASISNITLNQLTSARGLFANTNLLGDKIEGVVNDEGYTLISSKLFEATPNLQYLGSSEYMPGESTYLGIDSHRPSFAGMFANIPNLLIQNGCFKELTRLADVSKVFFVGRAADTDPSSYIKRSNVYPAATDDTDTRKAKFTTGSITDTDKIIDRDIYLFVDEYTNPSVLPTITNTAYMFAGQPNIIHIKTKSNSQDENYTAFDNITNANGMFMNCISLTCVDEDGACNFLELTQNKPQLTNVSLMYAGCKALTQGLGEGTDTIFKGSTAVTNCKGMFYSSGITGTIPATLFNTLRSSVGNVSYMFAKCKGITHINSGIAKNFNIPYQYDGSDVTYYYERNKADLQATYSDYATFKAAMNTYFTEDVRDNWFGTNEQFDRYRNYLEQWFFKNARYYPDNYTEATINTIKTISTRDLLTGKVAGKYYITTTEELVEYDSQADSPITDICSSSNGGTKRIYLKPRAGGTIINITEIPNPNDNQDQYQKLERGEFAAVIGANIYADAYSKYQYYYENNKFEIEQKGLLSDCINLTNLDYMFAGCSNIIGNIPADMLYFSSPNTRVTSLVGVFAGCSKLTVLGDAVVFNEATPNVVEEVNGAVTSYYNIIDWGNDTQVARSSAGNFGQIYPALVYNYNENADPQWTFTVADTGIYVVDFGNYFIPRDWIKNLPKINNISNLFRSVGYYTNDSQQGLKIKSSKTLSNQLYEYLTLDNTTFNNQRELSKANYAFANVLTLGGTSLTNKFMVNSSSTLKDISGIFAATSLLQVNEPFNSATNLTTVTDCFYGINSNYAANDDGPRFDSLFKMRDGITTSISQRMTSHSMGELKNSIAPPFWNFINITSNTKSNCFAGLHNSIGTAVKYMFDYRPSNPGNPQTFSDTNIAASTSLI